MHLRRLTLIRGLKKQGGKFRQMDGQIAVMLKKFTNDLFELANMVYFNLVK